MSHDENISNRKTIPVIRMDFLSKDEAPGNIKKSTSQKVTAMPQKENISSVT